MITFFAFWIGFFMGGVYVLAGALYSESSPKSKEWTLVLLTVCVAIGGVLVYLLAVIIVLVSSSDSLLWRLVAGCSCLIEVLCFFLLFLVFESPKFLMSRNDLEETRIVLK
jgi:MFS family permease